MKNKWMIRGLMLMVACICMASPVWACSSAVISGKITPDGRPLLWKTVKPVICVTTWRM